MGGRMEAIRVIIADDSAQIRQVFHNLLGKEADIEIVAEAANGAEAVEAVRVHAPHLLLLDINMPIMNGMEVIDELLKTQAGVRILVISGQAEPEYIRSALRAGADGYIVKDDIQDDLPHTIRQVVRGRGVKVNPLEMPVSAEKLYNNHVLVFHQ